jgi:hypothetical protein
MTRELYQRLVADLPHHALWSMNALHDHDLDNFADFKEIEIENEMIRRNLHPPSEHLSRPLTANESPTVFNSLSEDEEDQYDPIKEDDDIALLDLSAQFCRLSGHMFDRTLPKRRNN